MERGEYRPDGEQFGEGSEFQPYAALRKRGNLRLPTPVGTYTMLIDTWFEKHGEVSEEQSDSMWRVAVGFGFLVYDHMPETKQAVFLNILYNMREHNKEWAQAGREVELHSLTLSQ